MEDKRYIKISGVEVEVSEEIYKAYKRPAWRERKRREVRAEQERSLDAFIEMGGDYQDGGALVEDIVADKLLLETLYSALGELTDDERRLIDAIYFDDKTVREIALNTGKSKSAVQRAKDRVIEKLKIFFE